MLSSTYTYASAASHASTRYQSCQFVGQGLAHPTQTPQEHTVLPGQPPHQHSVDPALLSRRRPSVPGCEGLHRRDRRRRASLRGPPARARAAPIARRHSRSLVYAGQKRDNMHAQRRALPCVSGGFSGPPLNTPRHTPTLCAAGVGPCARFQLLFFASWQDWRLPLPRLQEAGEDTPAGTVLCVFLIRGKGARWGRGLIRDVVPANGLARTSRCLVLIRGLCWRRRPRRGGRVGGKSRQVQREGRLPVGVRHNCHRQASLFPFLLCCLGNALPFFLSLVL